MLAHPALTPKSDRVQWAQLMFDKFNAPGIFLAKEPVLTWCVRNSMRDG